jgi:dTDP-N-acetylfucosamine:lipid II N-acetylfucosaminyltransferase
MNLHLTYDNQFIDNIIRASASLGRDDKFVIYTNEEKSKLDSVKSSVPFAQIDSVKFKELVGDLSQYRNIYIHWLEGRIVEVVLNIPKEVQVIWCFWGGDGLELKPLETWVYQPKSFAYFRKLQRIRLNQIINLRTILYRRRMKLVNEALQIKAMQRVDFFAHYLPMDFEKIREVSQMKAQFIPFHYAALEDLVDTSTPPNALNGGDILLGNSDTLTNNHFEAIDVLSQLNLTGRKVVCPLSYERGSYAHDIKTYGENALGNAFMPLLDFMSKEAYGAVLKNISFAVMNHNRSQALGNIVSLLWNGTKVYMSEESTLYHYLLGEGLIVFSIQKELKSDNEHVFLSLEKEQVENNRSTLQRIFGREAHLQKINNMLEL